MCCSSVVSMAWGGALAGLSRLGQSNVRLPWRGPSRVSVHWTFVGLPGKTGLTCLRNRSDRISWRRCKEPSTRCTWRARVAACFSINSSPCVQCYPCLIPDGWMKKIWMRWRQDKPCIETILGSRVVDVGLENNGDPSRSLTVVIGPEIGLDISIGNKNIK